jgi:hypothetical protein
MIPKRVLRIILKEREVAKGKESGAKESDQVRGDVRVGSKRMGFGTISLPDYEYIEIDVTIVY